MSKAQTQTIVSTETYRQIYAIIDNAETCRNSFYWHPSGNAGGRRANERKFNVPQVVWQDGDDIYTAEFCYRESCTHVYAHGYYTKNGNKTTLTAVRNSLKRLIPHDVDEVDY